MRTFLILLTLLLGLQVAQSQPRLVLNGSSAHIEVNGQPMLMIGGELGNSSASTQADLHRIFPHLRQLGLNTALVPVSWELIEPQEGQFDMTSLQHILTEAREADLHVVLLWFGAWKNSMSCYAPQWFKRDVRRFPRAHMPNGMLVEEASSLSSNVLEADRRAFLRIMEYLRDNDTQHTVLMMQVENEIGMINVPRDYSPSATRLYKQPVPQQLVDYLHAHCTTLHPYLQAKLQQPLPLSKPMTWTQLFGDDIYTEELFQTWTYATYVQQLAQAGKAVYDLPMYVNVALDSRGRQPGQYPSGGPLAQLIDLWHCAAPAIDVLGVDIYDTGVRSWFQKYHLANNPLFVPEIRLEDRDAMYALYAFGHHDAMGFCPFSIEDYPLHPSTTAQDGAEELDLSQDDQLNAYSLHTSQLTPLAATYRLLRQAEPLILARHGSDDMEAVLLDDEHRTQHILTPDGVILTVSHTYSLGWEPGAHQEHWPEAACIILRLAPMEYLVIGSGVVITYAPAPRAAQATDAPSPQEWKRGDARIGLAMCQEVSIHDGALQPLRRLNGDQTHQGRHVRIPYAQYQLQHFTLYRY